MTQLSDFDAIRHTQGDHPHIMQYLWDAYLAYLEAEGQERAAKGQTVLPIAQAKTKAPATHFVLWAANHLRDIRAIESFFVDGNVGVRLNNNKTIAISPGVEIRGTMQDSGAVAVTEGRSEIGNNGVTDTDAMII